MDEAAFTVVNRSDDGWIRVAVFLERDDASARDVIPHRVHSVGRGRRVAVAVPGRGAGACGDRTSRHAAPAPLWLAIVEGVPAADGTFRVRSMTTEPSAVLPGQTATITGSRWRGYFCDVE